MPGIRGGVLWRPGGVVSVAGQSRLVDWDVSRPDWRLASIIKVPGGVVSRWQEFEGVSVRRTALALPPLWRLHG